MRARFKFTKNYGDILVWTLVEGRTRYTDRYMVPGDSIAFPRRDFWRNYA